MKYAIISALAMLMCFTEFEIEENYYISVNKYEDYVLNLYANWFDEIQYVFRRGDDAKIVDLQTGRKFYVRRTFGTNHADVEPLTKEDARIMYEIWGGFSWVRRPVAVYVAGQIFPASLTNFPHAGRDDAPVGAIVENRSGGYGRGFNFNAIQGNGIDGHVCLHFEASLTHVNNRLNADHQRAVTRARQILKEKHALY